MNIVEKPIKELNPYANNPRINDKAVEYVANSNGNFVNEYLYSNKPIKYKGEIISKEGD